MKRIEKRMVWITVMVLALWPVSGPAFIVTVDPVGDAGHFASMAVVNGNPAVSYLDNSNNVLKYVRANDARRHHMGHTGYHRFGRNHRPVDVPGSGRWEPGDLLLRCEQPRPQVRARTRCRRHLMGHTGDRRLIRRAGPIRVAGRGERAPGDELPTDSSRRMRYVRANDPDGATWAAPLSSTPPGSTPVSTRRWRW